jgi:hypothetical protein
MQQLIDAQHAINELSYNLIIWWYSINFNIMQLHEITSMRTQT